MLNPKTQQPIEVTRGSDNVFADLGLPDADVELAKAKLALALHKQIKARRLTQAKAAKLLNESQPNVSKITRGHIRKVSLDRLTRHLNALGMDVVVYVRTAAQEKGHLIVNAD
jgi:predicted XRE-type DNA-binding protein